MTRLSGIKVLILGIVLWGVAVWFLGAPRPAPTETSAAPVSAGTTVEPGAGEDEPAGSGMPDVPVPSATASRTPATSPGPAGTAVADASIRNGSADVTAAKAPAPASAATGDGARIAAAPASSGAAIAFAATPPASAASDTTGADAEPAAGSPFPPPAPGTGSIQENVAGPPILPPVPPQAWFEHSLPPPAPPARSGGGTADGGAVAGQINAARRAAWEGRLADALAHYLAAARIQPGLHVVWGEMGNVLWTMRRWSEAAYALEGAATLLARAGELRAASELVPAVESIDPDAAYRVKQLLWAAVQRQSG